MRPGKGSCHAEDAESPEDAEYAEDAEALPDGGAARALFPPCLLRALRDSTGVFRGTGFGLRGGGYEL
jgi:hypothetical protein